MTEYILYAWAWYYFILKVDYKRFKTTWTGLLKGIGLGICGNIVNRSNLSIIFDSLHIYDIDMGKVDMFLGIPLIIFSITKIAKLLNKRDRMRANKI
jgi:hypothetical protein